MKVHPTAIIEDGASLGEGVTIGPYCVIGAKVRLGDGCRLHSHVAINGDTEIGPECEFWPFASIGAVPQDRRLEVGKIGKLQIGHHNRFREHVTVSPGTPRAGGITRLGDHNMLLIGSHIGHDTLVGHNVVLTNGASAAGHTEIGDQAILGAMVGLHQFVRVGKLAMLGAGAMLPKDAPPFAMVHGDRARIRGVNAIGMRRAGMTTEEIAVVKRAFRMLFWRAEVMHERIRRVRTLWHDHPLVSEILDFMEGTRRGVLMARSRSGESEQAYASD